MPSQGSLSKADWYLLLLLSLLWGGAFFAVKIAVAQIPPLTLTLCRVGLAGASLALWMTIVQAAFPPRSTWGAFLVLGLFHNAIPFALICWAQMHIPSGVASILNATTPLFTVLVAHSATEDDKLTPMRAVGLAIGFLGVVALIGPDVQTLEANLLAQLAALGAALSYGIGAVYGRRFRAMPALSVATGQLTASTLLLLGPVALIDRPWLLDVPSGAALAATASLALLSTALAFLIYFRILASAGATNALLVTFLVPVSAILLGTVFLDERLGAQHVAGMTAITLGLATIDGRLPGRLIELARR